MENPLPKKPQEITGGFLKRMLAQEAGKPKTPELSPGNQSRALDLLDGAADKLLTDPKAYPAYAMTHEYGVYNIADGKPVSLQSTSHMAIVPTGGIDPEGIANFFRDKLSSDHLKVSEYFSKYGDVSAILAISDLSGEELQKARVMQPKGNDFIVIAGADKGGLALLKALIADYRTASKQQDR